MKKKQNYVYFYFFSLTRTIRVVVMLRIHVSKRPQEQDSSDLAVHLSIYLFIYLSYYLFIYLSMYTYVIYARRGGDDEISFSVRVIDQRPTAVSDWHSARRRRDKINELSSECLLSRNFHFHFFSYFEL